MSLIMTDAALINNRKRPTADWQCLGVTNDWTSWQKGEYCALSSLLNIDDGHQPVHLEWIVSFSLMGKARLNDKQIKECLKDFDALDFEEDNHEATGIARKFWLPVAYEYRTPCPCKDEIMRSQDDYIYSEKKKAD